MEKKRLVLALMVVLVAFILTVSVSYADVSIPQPEWFKGDTWTWIRIRNRNTSNPIKRTVAGFKKIDGIDTYEVLSGATTLYYTKSLGHISTVDKNGQLIYVNKPAMEYFKWPLQPGKKWHERISWKSLTDSNTIDHYSEVVGMETVKVPAGEFEAVKILRTAGAWRYTYWYSPEVKNYVKWITENPESTKTDELFDYKLGGSVENFIIKEPVVWPPQPKAGEYWWIIFKFASPTELMQLESEMTYEDSGQLVTRKMEGLDFTKTQQKFEGKSSGTVIYRLRFSSPGKRNFRIWVVDKNDKKSNMLDVTVEVN